MGGKQTPLHARRDVSSVGLDSVGITYKIITSVFTFSIKQRRSSALPAFARLLRVARMSASRRAVLNVYPLHFADRASRPLNF